jgi:hypothetical protein
MLMSNLRVTCRVLLGFASSVVFLQNNTKVFTSTFTLLHLNLTVNGGNGWGYPWEI